MPSVYESSHDRLRATGLEQALKDRNTAIIGDTLHFESESSKLDTTHPVIKQPSFGDT
jgi:hypothetical protein